MSATFDTMEGWWHQHAHGTTRSIERTQSILRNVHSGERRRRVGVRQSRQRKPIESLLHGIHANCEWAPTALPARQGALAADGMICRDAIRSSGADDDGGNGGGPNTGGRGTVGRR
jgi:hypothetical protein